MQKKLKQFGWWLLRQGKHEIWTNGELTIPIPRHDEINEMTARGILKDARTVKGKRKENRDEI